MPPDTEYSSPPARRPIAEVIGSPLAEDARLARGAAYQALLQIERIYARYGLTLIPTCDEESDLPTAFLAVWLDLVPDLIVLRDLLVGLTPGARLIRRDP